LSYLVKARERRGAYLKFIENESRNPDGDECAEQVFGREDALDNFGCRSKPSKYKYVGSNTICRADCRDEDKARFCPRRIRFPH
jgi:hypothetical protein